MTPEQFAEIKAQIENAHNEVGAICLEGAASRWRMSIPARQDRDSDLIISAALEGGAALIAEIERLTAELSDWREAASYWEGPEDCLERECEEFFDEDGNDRFEKDHCSHMTAKFLTPEEVAKVISGSLSGGEAE